jgi:hypothetical protein
MATLAPIRRSLPHATAQASTWPRTARILDADGAYLSDVDVPAPPRDGRLLLGVVGEPAALLDQCFGRGDRQVMSDLGDVPLEAWLETRWEGGHRVWWIELDE